MKFCLNCGAELKPEAKFCITCGTPIVVTPPPPVQPSPEPQRNFQQQEPVLEQAREAKTAFKEAFAGNTNLVQRVKNIILKPKDEWLVIASEQPDTMKLIGGYALILALIPAVSTFIAYGLIGTSEFMGVSDRSILKGLSEALKLLISTVAGVYLLAYVIDWLAPSFESEKNFGKSVQLSVYSYTAMWIAGILLIIPGIGFLTTIIGLYSIYLLAIGLPILKGVPQDKVVGYVALTIIAMIVITAVLTLIFGAVASFIFF